MATPAVHMETVSMAMMVTLLAYMEIVSMAMMASPAVHMETVSMAMMATPAVHMETVSMAMMATPAAFMEILSMAITPIAIVAIVAIVALAGVITNYQKHCLHKNQLILAGLFPPSLEILLFTRQRQLRPKGQNLYLIVLFKLVLQ